MTAQRPHRTEFLVAPASDWGLTRPAPAARPARAVGAALSLPVDKLSSITDAVAAYQHGDIEGAFAIIAGVLEIDPDWIDGYRTAAELLWQCGDPQQFADWLSHMVRRNVGKTDVTVTCLRMLSDAGLHGAIETLLPLVRSWAGEHLFFSMLGAVAASERGDVERADALFARMAEQGGTLALPHVSHLIRYGRPAQAANLAERFVAEHPENQTGWGLLSTAWRLMDDPRHGWLVERPGLVRCIDMDVEPETLDALAVHLRTMHVARTHPFDMSLRGGTQTAGNILDRDEPQLASLRLGFFSALYRYVAGLPPEDARHPLLSRSRGAITLSDSWSVRLLDGGYHVSHIHPVGSLSAAFYVALPPRCEEQPQAGWLTIGAPPADLGTGLPPLDIIEPKRGRLVLFPSYMWHGTTAFPKGERITVAFDALLANG
ncbi:MAG TPA: putative 2OG-Fe(II) oxygenase [Sphingobium sp.]|uniref:2OG-Fe(II) oxygenase family protein n=1 Tax=Sphingobium sp. TaxID=1912891 RepID=UPI002ED559CB